MKALFYFILLLGIASCNQSQPSSSESDPNSNEITSRIAIDSVLSNQQDSWNNGDIDAFMEGYWNSPELTFIGANGVTKGWNNTLNNYKIRYPDTKAMGKLEFETVSLDKISNDAFQMIGKYTLFRDEDQPSGYFTLLWRKINDKWVIVSDQTC